MFSIIILLVLPLAFCKLNTLNSIPPSTPISELIANNSEPLILVFLRMTDCKYCAHLEETIEEFLIDAKSIAKGFKINCSFNSKKKPSQICYEFIPSLHIYEKNGNEIITHKISPDKLRPTFLPAFADSLFPVSIENLDEITQIKRYFQLNSLVLVYYNYGGPSMRFKFLCQEFPIKCASASKGRSYTFEGEIISNDNKLSVIVAEEGKIVFRSSDFNNFTEIEEFLLFQKNLTRVKFEISNSMNESKISIEESGIKKLHFRNLDSQLQQNQKIVIVQFNRPNSSSSKTLQSIFAKMSNSFEYLEIIVHEHDAPELQELYPNYILPCTFVYPLGTKNLNSFKYFDDNKLGSILLFLSDSIPSENSIVKSIDIEKAITESLQVFKNPLIIFTNNRELSIGFRMLSQLPILTSKYRFISFVKPANKELNKFGIKRLPNILGAFEKSFTRGGGFQLNIFNQNFTYNNIRKFAADIAFDSLKEFGVDFRVKNVHNPQDFQRQCDSMRDYCLLVLVNEYASNNVLAEAMRTSLEVNIRLQRDTMSLFTIASVCHNYLLDELSLELQDLPTLIVYDTRNHRIIHQVGTFEKESLRAFVERVTKGEFSGMEYNLEIRRQICDLELEKFLKNQYIMSADRLAVSSHQKAIKEAKKIKVKGHEDL